jgi:hypothetical protein
MRVQERKRNVITLIHSLPTFPATLATPQSAAVAMDAIIRKMRECDRSFISFQLFQQHLPRLNLLL